MADPEKSSESQNPDLIQQDVEGSQNQIIGHAKDTVIIGRAGQITIQSPQGSNEITSKTFIRRSPYLGLNKFEVRDKHLFFGRDQLIDRLVARLQSSPLLLVLGASGSGKSSLVRAGLIPKLSENMDRVFREIIFTPDRDPFDSFRSSLRSVGFRQADIELLQTNQPEALRKTVHSLKQSDENWFIFIDQFEELFTLCQDLQKRQAFIEGLIQLVQAKIPSVQLVLAMRADFLGRLGAFPRLTGILQRSELITDMSDGELRLAIEKPAAQHGVDCEPELTENIIRDLKGHPTTHNEAERIPLTLLQYTLKLLWESSGDLSDRTLHVQTYRSLGGVRGALQRQVDEINARLPEEQKQATKHIFLQLIDTVGADAGTTTVGKAVSRRAVLDEFNPAEQQVLYKLVDAGLLVSDDSTSRIGEEGNRPFTNHKATVELAHETLIDAWDTLRAWIEESRPLIRLKHQLREDALRWYQIHHDNPTQSDAELWQGSKLKHLQSQREEMVSRFGDFKPEEVQFVKACEELGDRHARAELDRQRQQKRLYRSIAGGAIAGLALVSGLAAFSIAKWRAADRGQIQALISSSEANFQLNPGALDSLVDGLKAGSYLNRSFGLQQNSELRQQVMQVLGQSLNNAREYNRFTGHNGYVMDLAMNSDGNTIASVSYDKTIRFWNANGSSGKTLTLPDEEPLTSISVSPDGKIFAVATYAGTVNLIDKNGKPLVPALVGHTGPIRKVAFSPDGQLLATAGEDGTLRFWQSTGQPLTTRTLTEVNTKFLSVAFSPDGSRIAAGREDGKVLVLDNQGTIIQTLSEHTGAVYGVAFSPDSQVLVTASEDRRAILWDINTGLIQAVLTGHTEGIRDVAFNPNGSILATGSYDGTIKLWSRQGELLDELQGHRGQVLAITFSADGKTIASASDDRTVRLWRFNPCLTRLTNHSSEVFAVDFAPSGDRFVSGDFQGVVRLWSNQCELLKEFPIQQGPISKLAFSPDGELVATANADGSVTLLNLQGEFPAATLLMHEEPVVSVNFSSDSQILATAGFDKTIKLWNRNTQEIKLLTTYSEPLRDVAWNADSTVTGVAANDGTIQLLTPDGTLLKTFQAHKGIIYRLAFSPNNPQVFATASEDQTVKLWHTDGTLLSTLTGHRAPVGGVEFSPVGGLIATASDDNTIKIWEQKGELLTTLIGHKGLVNSIDFNASGTLLVSGSSDYTVRTWDVSNVSLNGWLAWGCQWTQLYLRLQPQTLQELCTRKKIFWKR